MNNPDLYNRTVDILVGAYFDDTLERGVCQACAVGNIVARNNNYTITKVQDQLIWLNSKGRMVYPKWVKVFRTSRRYIPIFHIQISVRQEVDIDNYSEEAVVKEILSTGYNVSELAQIEYAFEKGASKRGDQMFNGLMAVIEVLDKIHGNEDAAISQATKNRFNKVQNPIK